VRRLKSTSRRNLSLLTGSLFVFFIISAAPHLVHHSFDEAPATTCKAFAVAKGCSIQPLSVTGLALNEFIAEEFSLSLDIWVPHFAPSPFLQRAPPQA
jgi:hypothetical protein